MQGMVGKGVSVGLLYSRIRVGTVRPRKASMGSKRLELALDTLNPAHWERFERFASQFLVSDLPDIRTVAAPSGDGGRDAELFSPASDPTHVLQYSIVEDWASKIRHTAKRISETIPAAQLLTYVTNRQIGADADELKRELRKEHRLHLDVRDRSYFLDRIFQDASTEAAAESLARDIVDPYLSTKGVLAGRPAVLESNEARAAHVYLSLQLRDEAQEKGLTKLSFEALIRSVLVGTGPEKRMSHKEIRSRVRQLLPHDAAEQVEQLTDSALTRLTKHAIRHYVKEDEFCLSYEESQRLAEYLATQELREAELRGEIEAVVGSVAAPPGSKPPANIPDVGKRVRRILERCLYERAEAFADAVLAEGTSRFATDHVQAVVLEDLKSHPAQKGDTEGNPQWLAAVVREMLATLREPIQQHLRDLADAYTLLVFLRQTPDVQGAVRKIFSYGQVWLDTTIILPLLAEELLEDGRGRFQQMIRIASDAGMEFSVTAGVVEEVDRHINLGLLCARQLATWNGPLPFLLEAFLQSGRGLGEFERWTETFRGGIRPLDDIFEWLQDRFGIRRFDLEEAAEKVPVEFRQAVQESWYKIHSERRERAGKSVDLIAVNRLSKHDTENYVGVVQKRSQETASALGYRAWWLTLDRRALSIPRMVKQDFGIDAPQAPVMSIDFLGQYLTLGPARSRVPKASVRQIGVTLEPRLVSFLTRGLVTEAAAIREEMKNLPENVIRRRVRDHLDEARRKMGPMAMRGAAAVLDEITPAA